MAEGAGFEPAIPCGIHALQACALVHYATPPQPSVTPTGQNEVWWRWEEDSNLRSRKAGHRISSAARSSTPASHHKSVFSDSHQRQTRLWWK